MRLAAGGIFVLLGVTLPVGQVLRAQAPSVDRQIDLNAVPPGCGSQTEAGTGVVWGHVVARSDRGRLWGHGESVPANEGVVILDDALCGSIIDARGVYVIKGIPSGLYQLEARWIGWPYYRDTLRIAGDTTRLDIVLTEQGVLHEFDRFQRRPPVLTSPDGVLGCYWFGGTPYAEQVIRLNPDSTVEVPLGSDSRARWEEHSDPRSIFIVFAWTGFYGSTATIAIGDAPDWSDLHVRYSSWSDDGPRNVARETFATRVPCDQ